MNIYKIFLKQVKCTPNSVAIISESKKITYRKLLKLSERLAQEISLSGINKDDMIIVALPRSIDFIVTILAILKVGAVYIPLDIDAPQDRLSKILSNIDASVVITKNNWRHKLVSFKHTVIFYNNGHVEHNRIYRKSINKKIATPDLAYIIYTSGTTGTPKGVMIKHISVINLVKYSKFININNASILGHSSNVCFDVSMFEIWGTLLNGASLVIIPNDTLLSVNRLDKEIKDNKISILWLTSGLFNYLVSEDSTIFKSLSYLLIGGEALNINKVKLLFDTDSKPQHIINGYGPTEGTIFATTYEVEKISEKQKSLPIGKPILNTEIAILKNGNVIKKPGVVGELCLSGLGLSAGYYKQLELSNEKFPQLYSEEHNLKKWYKTGDLGCYLDDGNVEYIGRLDRQIKIRGYRVEAQDIENTINKIKEVKNSFVNLENNNGHSTLVAYVSIYKYENSEKKLASVKHIIIEHLKTFLPYYMIPNHFVILDKLALNNNGKVDAKALSEKYKITCKKDFEKSIQNLFYNELLKSSSSNAEENFFELGGDSLQAIHLINTLNKKYNANLSFADILKNPTVKDLSRLVRRVSDKKHSQSQVIISDDIRLNKIQESIWVQQKISKDKSIYKIPLAIKISGKINKVIFKESLNLLIRNQPSLRTIFFTDSNDNPKQKVINKVESGLKYSTISNNELIDIDNSLKKKVDICNIDDDGIQFIFELIELSESEHIFLAIFDHIIFDGYSRTIFIKDLVEIYNMVESGYLIDDLVIENRVESYISSIVNKDSVINDSSGFDSEKNDLYTNTAVKNMHSGNKSNAVQQYRICLSEQETKNIRYTATKHKTTDFIVVLAILQMLAHKTTGMEDSIIGVPFFNRDGHEKNSLIGCFVDVLPIVSYITDANNFSQLLEKTKASFYKSLATNNKISENMLFNMALVDNNYINTDKKLGGASIGKINLYHNVGLLDLRVLFEIHGGHIELVFEYKIEIFSKKDIIKMAQRFLNILEESLKKYKSNFRSVVDLFQYSAKEHPNEIALSQAGSHLTYKELNAKSNQFARYLKSINVESTSLIGLALPSSMELFTLILSILKIKAVYLPIDINYPQQRVKHILDDSQCSVIITKSIYKEKFSSLQHNIIFIDEVEIDKFSNDDFESQSLADSLAYVLYTSGSSGKPKGVEISHRSLSNLAVNQAKYLNITKGSRVLQFASPGFDAAISEWSTCFVTGATLCLPIANDFKEKRLLDVFTEEKITHVTVPPCFAEILPNEILKNLNVLIIAGEKFNSSLIKKITPFVTVINAYGPTEATVCSTMKTYHDIDEHNNIGSAIANVSVYILDENKNPVSQGQRGEIYIGGLGLARGYRNNKQLTQDKFINVTINGIEKRLYRSGDIGYFINRNEIKFVDRLDRLIKIHGYRIEPAEVEKALCEHDAIKKAIVTKSISQGQEKLVAYLIFYEEASRTLFSNNLSKQIRNFLTNKLPEFMIPSAYMPLEKIPVTHHGKIDYQNLPCINDENNKLKNCDRKKQKAQDNSLTQKIEQLLCGILNKESIDSEDNFFDLGVDSLASVKLSLAAKRQGITIDIKQIFDYPTIASLSSIITDNNNAENLTVKYQKLSKFQEGLYFLSQSSANQAEYNIPYVVRISSGLNLKIFQESFLFLLQRHDLLRSKVEISNKEQPQLYIDESLESINIIDMLTADIDKIDLTTLIKEEINKPFDLEKEKLLRCLLYQFSNREHLLVIVMHHLICDGYSMDVFLSELSEIYTAKYYRQDIKLQNIAQQYSDYVTWQIQQKTTEDYQRKKDYWLTKLSKIPSCLNLSCGNYNKIINSEGIVSRTRLNLEVTKLVKSIAKEQQTTIFVTLLTLFKILLHHYAEEGIIVVGIPASTRGIEGYEQTIGPFLNSLAIVTDISRNDIICNIFRRVRDNVITAYENNDVAFPDLVADLKVTTLESRMPIFQVYFSEESSCNNLDFPEVVIEVIDSSTATAKFDLTMMFRDINNEIDIYFEYPKGLFDDYVIKEMLSRFKRMIYLLSESPSNSVKALSFLYSQQQDLLISAERETPVTNIIYKFEEVAEIFPNRVAVKFNEIEITYQQLNNRANQLANYLLLQNIGQNDIVAILLDKSVDTVIAIIAILKSGAAYLPLDPLHPSKRINFIINDANAKLVLTSRCLTTKCSKTNSDFIILDEKSQDVSLCSEDKPVITVSGSSLAYVIYTSGTTGKPKGVMVEHKNLLHLIDASKSIFTYRETDVWCLFHSTAFDFSVWEMWGAFFSGAKLIIISDEITRSSLEFYQLIMKEGVTILNQTPSALFQLFSLPAFDFSCIPSMRYIILGGEKLCYKTLSKYIPKNIATVPEIYNLYGSTESTIHSTYHCINFSEDFKNCKCLIGKALSHLNIYLLDNQLNLAPSGALAEIYIAGAGLAKGYLGQEQLTKEKFIVNPYSVSAEDKFLYKTGDMGKVLSNGSIEYIGRYDNQVKIRGYRIELSEIESVINSIDFVERAVVVTHKTNSKNIMIIAYVKIKQNNNIEIKILVTNIKNALIKSLPFYMQPDHYETIDEIQLTSNGKIDLSSLPKPNFEYRILQPEYMLPRSAIEDAICKVFIDILGTNRVGINDSFFSIGGNSILVVRLMIRINSAFNTNVTVKDLYKHSNVSALSKFILSLSTRSLASNIINICDSTSDKCLFLIHPSSSLSVCYTGLHSYLDSSFGVYVINNPHFGNEEKSFQSVEKMAEDYCKAIQSIKKSGPYYLGGWSFGGLVAYEVAKKLQEKGEEVLNVILIDSFNRDLMDEDMQTDATIKQDLLAEGIDIDADEGKSIAFEVGNNWRLMMAYRVVPYSGRVTLIKAQNSLPVKDINGISNGWGKYLSKPIDIYSIPCRHGNMFFQSHIKRIAELLNEILLSKEVTAKTGNNDCLFNQYINFASKNNDQYLVDLLLKLSNK